MKHIEEPPPSPRQFNPDLSPAIEAVVLHALEKAPERRFQSGAEFASALRQAIKASVGG
jgi:serine/threonine-protein kinase